MLLVTLSMKREDAHRYAGHRNLRVWDCRYIKGKPRISWPIEQVYKPQAQYTVPYGDPAPSTSAGTPTVEWLSDNGATVVHPVRPRHQHRRPCRNGRGVSSTCPRVVECRRTSGGFKSRGFPRSEEGKVPYIQIYGYYHLGSWAS